MSSTQDQTASPWRASVFVDGDAREATPSADGVPVVPRFRANGMRAIGKPSIRQIRHAEERTLTNLRRLNADPSVTTIAQWMFAFWLDAVTREHRE